MSPTTPGIRARNRAAIEREILRVATRHLARDGAAGLSLRAIARELEMASSAVYRYVPSRDELLTLLIVQAYGSLGDAVDRAVAPAVEPLERFRVVGRTTRRWARRHPHQFALLYGSPVPGYDAPAERTTGPGTRVTTVLVGILGELQARRRTRRDPRAEQALAGVVDGLRGEGVVVSADLLSRGLAAWTLVLGAITAEAFEQFGRDTIADPEAHFEAMLDLAVGLVTG